MLTNSISAFNQHLVQISALSLMLMATGSILAASPHLLQRGQRPAGPVLSGAAVPIAGVPGEAVVYERSDARSPDETKKLEEAAGWKFGYRIPSLLVTETGTVLAFADRRKVGIGTRKDGVKLPDGGIPADVVLKRSSDGGKTWQTEQILFPAGSCNYHSAMAVADNKSG